MRITANHNLIQAIQNQDGITDRHLPIYIRDYIVTIPSQYMSKINLLWSTVSFLPSYVEFKRILNIKLGASIIAPLGPYHSSLANLSFTFDFSELNDFLKDIFLVSVEGPIEGNISFGESSETFNANNYVDYDYQFLNGILTLFLKNLTFEITSFPMTLYMNINIRDDIDDQSYPRLFPSQVAKNILAMPSIDISNNGNGVTIVMLLLFCCPNELKTLQISTTDISLPGAFNPTFDITNLLLEQGIPIPGEGFDFRFQPARTFESVDVEPIDWKQSSSMVQINYDMQNLYTSVPNASVIILYDDFSNINIQEPSYMSWLNNNTNEFDIVLLTGYVVRQTQWTPTPFSETETFYEDVLTNLENLKKPVITICDEDGTNETLQFPSPKYNFVAANTKTLTLGGIQLSTINNYLIQGPYSADTESGGGYCSETLKPPYQTEYVVAAKYGRPDFAGYSRDLIFSLNGNPSSSYGLGFAIQPLAAIFAKIYVATQKKDWDFKFIVYRKGSSLCKSIVTGQNQQYECSRFAHCSWNPVTGFGNMNFNTLYQMCHVIRNNTLIQISNIDLPGSLSFLNSIPNNPFSNIISTQPVFGFSSIFSFFKIYTTNTIFPSTIPIAQTPILTNSSVYLLDMTEQYALAWGLDENSKLYVFLQNVNYGSTFQQWRLFDPSNTSVIRPIFAFDPLTLSPVTYLSQYLSGRWNANGSSKPSCPSISNSSTSTERFVFNTDNSVDVYVNDIRYQKLNDNVWSYYTNFTYYNPEPSSRSLFYLRNANLLSLNSPPTSIYNARQEAQEFDRTPRWGDFNEYPEWVLIPLNVDYDPTMYVGDVDDENSTVGTYLIFNTVTLSYLFFGFGKILEKAISTDLFEDDTNPYRFHINQFIFGLSTLVELNNKVDPEDLFSPTVPPKEGLPENSPYEISKRENIVVLHVETNPDGYFQRCAWKIPITNMVGEELKDGLFTDEIDGFSLTLYWVSKRYMVVNETEDVRLIAYNGLQDDEQMNNGFAISSNPDPQNVNNNAPSMSENVNVPSTRWRLTNNSKVKDRTSNFFYIYYDENLKHASQTNLRIISANDPSFRAIGVDGDIPQPRLVDRNTPVISEWSVTTTSFPRPPNTRQRRNYLYKGEVYSFYSYNEILTGGFLSSLRDLDEDDNGWDPSMIEGYVEGEWIYVGDVDNCYFVII